MDIILEKKMFLKLTFYLKSMQRNRVLMENESFLKLNLVKESKILDNI